MIRAHKIRLNPTPDQETYLRKACGVARFTYNWAFARWKEYKEQGVKNCDPVNVLKKEFNAIKQEQFPWVYEVPKSAADTGFFRLKVALKNYYDSKSGKRKGVRMGFPRFKSKKRSRPSFAMAYDQVTERNFDGHNLRLPLLATPVNMAEPLRYRGKVRQTIVSFDGLHWYASVQVEIELPAPISHEHKSVGVDLGIKTLATLSDGMEYENQVLLRSELKKLKRLSRQVSRRSLLYKLRKAHPEATQETLLQLYGSAASRARAEGKSVESGRWRRAVDDLTRFHRKIRNRRSYITHKMTKEIAQGYALIGVEDLNVKGMAKNRRLALHINDASFGEILRQLEYKAEWYGGQVVKVGRFYASSKTCSDCGHVNKELTLNERKWTCQGCGVIHERDWNASLNIEREALRLAAA